jgi:hypothetical protein
MPQNYWIYAKTHVFHTQSGVRNNVHEQVTKGISLQTYRHEANVERHFAQSLRTEFTQVRTDSATIQKSPILQTLN